jgi:hypothetical protein
MAFYTSFLVNLILERPAQRLTMTEYALRLQRTGEKIERHLDSVSETVRNRIVLRHLIGIERWGQRRLRVALAEPLVLDEYDDYRPDKSMAWEDMKELFVTTRNETVALARKLESVVMPDMTIPHNTYGNLTLRGWLRYLDLHARWENRKIK